MEILYAVKGEIQPVTEDNFRTVTRGHGKPSIVRRPFEATAGEGRG